MATKKSKEEADFTVDWIVLQSIRHNGDDYQAGDSIALTEKESASLLELDVIGAGVSEISVESETDKTPPEGVGA